MDSSVSPKDEIWFLRVCHHISNAVYIILHCKLHHVLLHVSSFTSEICRVHFSSGERDIYGALNKSFVTFIGMLCDTMVIISVWYVTLWSLYRYMTLWSLYHSKNVILVPRELSKIYNQRVLLVFPFFFIKALRLFTAVSMRIDQPQVAQSWLFFGVLIGREECWINSQAFRKISKPSLQ